MKRSESIFTLIFFRTYIFLRLFGVGLAFIIVGILMLNGFFIEPNSTFGAFASYVMFAIAAFIFYRVFFVIGWRKFVAKANKPKWALSDDEILRVQNTLYSDAMKRFEQKNAVSDKQKRWLAFGAMLMTINGESSRIFKMYGTYTTAFHIESIAKGWGLHMSLALDTPGRSR
jgi:hypothetical protein